MTVDHSIAQILEAMKRNAEDAQRLEVQEKELETKRGGSMV